MVQDTIVNTDFLGFSDPVSSMLHLLGALVFLVLGIRLLYSHRGNTKYLTSMSVFIFAVVFALSMSGVYHLLTPATLGRAVMQRLDHAAIFTLIAATFTPVHVMLFRGILRWGFLFLIWVTALTGITLKTIFFNNISEWLGLIFYLGLGWLGAVSGWFIYRSTRWLYLKPLIFGALAYTAGAVIDFVQQPVLIPQVLGPHELFHIMVLAGITLHWIFLVRIVTIADNRALPVHENYESRKNAVGVDL